MEYRIAAGTTCSLTGHCSSYEIVVLKNEAVITQQIIWVLYHNGEQPNNPVHCKLAHMQKHGISNYENRTKRATVLGKIILSHTWMCKIPNEMNS